MLGARAVIRGAGWRGGSPAPWCLLALCFACGGGSATEEAAPALRDQAIIRGSLAAAAEFDHTGALTAIDRTTQQRSMFCTATLIAPETVVTAKHCALAVFQAESLDLDVAWLVGPSVTDARELIPIAAMELAAPDVGGFLGIGRDVAVVHLDRAAEVEPIEVRTLSDEQIGQVMVSLGYGVFSPIGTEDGRRRVGRETLLTASGRALEGLFGSFENYVEWSFTGSVTSANFLSRPDFFVSLLLPQLRRDFDSVLLLDGYEAVTGRAQGDTQTCSGDSGGPLLQRTPEGAWETYGVVSGGPFSAQSVCDFGSVYATFGPETLDFLERARDWSDPCGDVSAQAACQGGQIVRCASSVLDEVRQLAVTRDCAALGQACVDGEAGPECQAPAAAASTDAASAEVAAPEPGAAR